MNQMVSFKDYAGMNGFGASSQSEVDDLNKSLMTGYGVGTSATTEGGVLRVESLEATLRVVTFTLKNIKFWPRIPKLPAFSTTEEYNVLTSYGNDAGAFNGEGELPDEQDANFDRKSALVKFLGTTRSVSHPATLVRPAHGSVIALETQNGAIWLVEKLERALFGGRSDFNTLAFDGMDKQILDGAGLTSTWDSDPLTATGGVVIDCRDANSRLGGIVGQDELEIAANTIVENYGVPTEAYFTPRAISNTSRSIYERQRMPVPIGPNGQFGAALGSFLSSAGVIDFNGDVFLRPGRNGGLKGPPAAATSANAATPGAPNTCTCTAGADGTGKRNEFKAADAGNYYYAITAVNRYGESTAWNSGAIAVAAGQIVTIKTTVRGTGVPTSYRIYRTKVGDPLANAKLLMEVSTADIEGAAGVIDRNWFVPGSARAYMFQGNVANFSFRQLAPMMKIPLATLGPAIRWMQLLYGVPVVYTPQKNAVFINVDDG